MASPNPASTAPPKEESGFGKDLRTIGSRMLGGVTRGVGSGAFQFGKIGLAIGAVSAFIFFGTIGWPGAFAGLAYYGLAGAALGAAGTGLVNLVGGLINGIRENGHRHRSERAAEKAQQASQAQGRSASPSPSNEVSTLPEQNPSVTTGQAYSSSNGVKVPRASGQSAEVVTPGGASEAATPTSSFGQGPSSGGSWQELVRQKSAAMGQVR